VGRQEEALRVAEELLADIELERLKASEIALKASRVARLVGHEELIEFLRYERSGYPLDGTANEWIDRTGRWSSQEESKFYPLSIAKVEAQIAAAQQAVEALQGGGNYSGDAALLASRDADTQTKVDGSLSAASGSALDKIERVSDRLRDGDPESVSQALTTCRRLIDSCADHLFPDQPEPYAIGEEVTLNVGQQNVLNRLQAYAYQCGCPKSRRDRLRRTLSDLYGRCSAGTHAEVTVDEARFVFLQTYVVLGEILTLSRAGNTPTPPTPGTAPSG
jgi:hypothetical protein